MISEDEKNKIKEEIVTKVNSVLEKNNESYRMDQVNILNKSETIKFMGNNFLKKYGDVDIKSKKIRDSGMKFTTVSFNFEL